MQLVGGPGVRPSALHQRPKLRQHVFMQDPTDNKSPRSHQLAHYSTLPTLKSRRHTSSEDALTVASSKGNDSATTWPDAPESPRADNNGSNDLHDKLAGLEALVSAQRDLLTKQQAALDQLQQRVEISQPRPGIARSTSAAGQSVATSSGSVRPFDAQRRAGYGDRRYLGLYDARFHSTSSYVMRVQMEDAQVGEQFISHTTT